MTKKRNYEAQTLDDLLRAVLQDLLEDNDYVSATRSSELGPFTEIVGATLALSDPRSRLSRSESKGKLFSALGEFFWYMSGSIDLDFIEYYLPGVYEKESDNGVVHSGYGDRLFNRFGINQLDQVISQLKNNPTSRRAVVQIFSALDLEYKSVPCTCTLQFLLRNERLNLVVNMRSNDAYLGLPHDVFAFTMIQELVARCLDVDVGNYMHFVGSLHLYEKHRPKAEAFLAEGWQNEISMDPMPLGDPFPALKTMQCIEQQLREDAEVDISSLEIEDYWRDMGLMLAVWKQIKRENFSECDRLKSLLKTKYYSTFIDGKMPQ